MNRAYMGNMRKDALVGFRIPEALKKEIQRVADNEARTFSQVCEIFLTLALKTYQSEGPSFLHRFSSVPLETAKRSRTQK